MDPKLAEIYGTGSADQEKLAASQLAEKLAAGDDDEIDLGGLSADQAEELAAKVLETDDDEDEGDEDESDEETQEKVAEADFLGRVMAHSYTQEMNDIEKTAGRGSEAKAALLKARAGFTGRAGRGLKRGGKKVFKAIKGGYQSAKGRAGKMYGATKEHVGRHSRKYLAAGGVATGAGGYALGKNSSATGGSAFEKLVMSRAQEILQESGIEPGEKTAGTLSQEEGERLSIAVENAARAVLENEGYQFEE